MNIPMVKGLLDEEGLKVCWTSIWRNSYGRLFKHHMIAEPLASSAGPDADVSQNEGQLVFKFAPDMSGVLNPRESPVGSDGWAIAQGWASVTALRASFAEAEVSGLTHGADIEGFVQRLKL